ncbi:MAG: T9SS type A sorting domain-containing protein [Paludibacter sp.]|nr:T9SS type A sorting domain-containing protein [Paludibacter sp.]
MSVCNAKKVLYLRKCTKSKTNGRNIDRSEFATDRSTLNGGGVQKWTESGGAWTLAYTLNLGIGARGLVVDWAGVNTNPIIYSTGTDSKIYKTEDTGSNATGVVLATAGTNTAFRGIAFTPDLGTSLENLKRETWTLSNNTLTFSELPTSKIEVFTLTGSKAALYEPAQSIELKLSKGIYILKVDNQTSKIVLK